MFGHFDVLVARRDGPVEVEGGADAVQREHGCADEGINRLRRLPSFGRTCSTSKNAMWMWWMWDAWGRPGTAARQQGPWEAVVTTGLWGCQPA